MVGRGGCPWHRSKATGEEPIGRVTFMSRTAREALRPDAYLVRKRAQWDAIGAADGPFPGTVPVHGLSVGITAAGTDPAVQSPAPTAPPSAHAQLEECAMEDKRRPREGSPYPRPKLPAPPKRPAVRYSSQGVAVAPGGGGWDQELAPLHMHTQGFHTAVLSHDGLFPHQGPQWHNATPPPVKTPPLPPQGYARPRTALGYELRARRQIGDWGLGEAGRSRREADEMFEKHFPMWGRVGGEKTSAIPRDRRRPAWMGGGTALEYVDEDGDREHRAAAAQASAKPVAPRRPPHERVRSAPPSRAGSQSARRDPAAPAAPAMDPRVLALQEELRRRAADLADTSTRLGKIRAQANEYVQAAPSLASDDPRYSYEKEVEGRRLARIEAGLKAEVRQKSSETAHLAKVLERELAHRSQRRAAMTARAASARR